MYLFDWQSPAGFQYCHCLEIPFVFNNFANWTSSPMLKVLLVPLMPLGPSMALVPSGDKG